MEEVKQALSMLNNINGGLMVIFGMTLNEAFRRFKRWRKKDVTTLDDKVSNIEITVDSLVKSNLALSHDKLYNYCTTYLERGYVTVGELDNLEYLFDSYKKLGGNGTGEHLYNEVKKLKVKGDN